MPSGARAKPLDAEMPPGTQAKLLRAVERKEVQPVGANEPFRVVLIDVNLIPTGATLPDGRPIYSTAVNAATRVDPTFNQVNMVRSIGESKVCDLPPSGRGPIPLPRQTGCSRP